MYKPLIVILPKVCQRAKSLHYRHNPILSFQLIIQFEFDHNPGQVLSEDAVEKWPWSRLHTSLLLSVSKVLASEFNFSIVNIMTFSFSICVKSISTVSYAMCRECQILFISVIYKFQPVLLAVFWATKCSRKLFFVKI